MDIIYKYDKNSLLSFYDVSFNKNYVFEYELINNDNINNSSYNILRFISSDNSNKKTYINFPFKKPVYKNLSCGRKIVYKDDLAKYNHLKVFKTDKTNDGILYFSNAGHVLLIPVGDNIYLLAFYQGLKRDLKSMLYGFMSKNNCVIDVSKFSFLFKDECKTLKVYKIIK